MLSDTICIGERTRQTSIMAAISAPSDMAPSMTRKAPRLRVRMPARATRALVKMRSREPSCTLSKRER